MKISDNRRLFEVLGVFVTGAGKFIFMDYLDFRFAFITTACLFWIVYVVVRSRQQKDIKAYWGLTTQNFKKTLLELLPFALVLAALMIFIGEILGTSVLNVRILPIIFIYPLWGIIQQFIMIGIVATNLRDANKLTLGTFWIALITATLFAIVHFPFFVLVGATFGLAMVYTALYLKGRNLIVLGIYHGILGAVFFYTIMGRDAYLEVFAKLGL